MATLRFTTTRLSGLRASGRVGEMQHAVITTFLQRELGDRHALLFADFEPEGSDQRAWYTEALTTPRRAADLPAPEGKAIRASAAALVADIRALAERIASEGPQRANLSRILLAAITYPEEDLWSDGEQPILVNWGFGREDRAEATPRAITGLAPVLPPKTTAASRFGSRIQDAGNPARAGAVGVLLISGSGGSVPWVTPLLWLLFLVLLGTVYGMLLPACGVDGRWRPFANWTSLNACERSAQATQVAQEGAQLEALVRQAELQLAQQKQLCTKPADAEGMVREIENRLPATAPRGDVEISLVWDGHADLDLIIDCPNNEHLSQASYGLQACGGRLLADVNKAGGPIVDHPIEHAAWDRPPPGMYTVKAELYDYNDAPRGSDVPFTVHVRRGAEDRTYAGHVSGAHTRVTAAEVRF